MTLIEFIIIFFTIIGAAGGAIWGMRHGIIWGISGFFLGGVIGYAISAIPLMVFVALGRWFGPPNCRTDSTHKGHLLRRARFTKEGTLWNCDCGLRYLETRWKFTRSARFLEILPDGFLRPYMKRKPCGKWQPDADEPPPMKILPQTDKQ